MNRLIALSLLFLAAGCAAQATSSPTPLIPAAPITAAVTPAADLATTLTNLKTKTIADLTAAQADATTDPIAAACWPTLVTWINSLPAPATLSLPDLKTAAGPVDAFQRLRNTRHGAESLADQVKAALASGVPVNVRLGCAALVVDEVQLANRIIALAAGVSAANAFAPLLPAANAVILPSLVP